MVIQNKLLRENIIALQVRLQQEATLFFFPDI